MMLPSIAKNMQSDLQIDEGRRNSVQKIQIRDTSIIKNYKTAGGKHRSKKSIQRSLLKNWDTDLKIPDGLTFAEIGDLSSQKIVKSKKVEAREKKQKEEQINIFIEKNKKLMQNMKIKIVPWSSIDKYISPQVPTKE